MEQLFGEAELVEFESIATGVYNRLPGSISLFVNLTFCVAEPIKFEGSKFTIKHFIKNDTCWFHGKGNFCRKNNQKHIDDTKKYIENELGLNIGSKVKISCPHLSEDIFFSQKDFLIIEDSFLSKQLYDANLYV